MSGNPGDVRKRPPRGSKPISETPWAGDHAVIAGQLPLWGNMPGRPQVDRIVTAADRGGRRRKEFFILFLCIQHPSANPDEITQTLGWSPVATRRAGDHWRTKGGLTSPNKYKSSYWAQIRVVRSCAFLEAVLDIVSELQPHRAFLDSLRDTGGDIWIRVHLPGDRNVGDRLDGASLRTIADAGIGLLVEVFPGMNLPTVRKGQVIGTRKA